MGDDAFFSALCEGAGGSSDFGDVDAGWDAARFESAVEADPGSEERSQLISALVGKFFGSYDTQAGGRGEAFISLDKGLSVISRHAKNLGYDALAELNPKLIMVRLSGFGQTGPYKDRVGFGAIGESMGGMRYITGYPDRAPVRVGISIGDSLAAMYGAMGALLALHQRGKTGRGQMVDVALYEAVFSMMESMLPEFGTTGFVRERSGASLPGIVPSNTYLCGDGQYVVIGANGDSIFKRMMLAIGRADLANDATLVDNAGRVKRTEELDAAIGAWTGANTLDQVLVVLDKADVPSGRIYSIADIVADMQYQARGMIEKHKLGDNQEVVLPGIVPKLSDTPGGTKWIGPKLGEHTAAVLHAIGYDDAAQTDLRNRGVI